MQSALEKPKSVVAERSRAAIKISKQPHKQVVLFEKVLEKPLFH
ncbi:MAG: hypothetical protein PUP91_12035 [Rhizonema sp. PD37]|nr:hypothetical protein [Rhizonema sp. PD37]